MPRAGLLRTLCAAGLLLLAAGCAGPGAHARVRPAQVTTPAPAAVTAPAPAAAPAPAPAAPVTISIVATNDVHGRLEQLPLLGGYVRNLRALRGQEGGAVLLLDGGDMFQGTLPSNMTEGAAMVRAYNALGYAAAAIGNHEFDFGPAGPHSTPIEAGEDPLGALRERAAQARFPLLCANIARRDGGAFPIAEVTPSALFEVAGVKVGVVGGTTEEALALTQAPNVNALASRSLADSVAHAAAELRARGAVLVIAAVHAGGECSDVQHPDDLGSCVPDSEGFRLARALPPGAIDLIVGGHTHNGVAHHVQGIPFIESYSNGRAFGRVDFVVDRARRRVLSHVIHPPHALCTESLDQPACTTEEYAGAPVERDARVSDAIAADLANAAEARARPIGVVVEREIKRAGNRESPLGNLVADLMREARPGADVAINNGGSLRTNLAQGPLTYGRLFEMFPFDNTFATLRVPARVLAEIIAKSLQSERSFLAVSGVRAAAHCEGSTLRVELWRKSGARIPPDTTLSVVTSDFLASGGDELLPGIAGAQDAVEFHRDVPMRDALIRGLAAVRGGRLDGRARALFDPAHPRVRYVGERPLQCPAPAAP
jgi:5'-nucleotidase